MPNTFLVADTHFGHAGVCKFLHPDGVNKLRPWDHPDDMDKDLIEAWNAVVRPHDKVYHLGDVVINRKALKTLAHLNGDKVLVKGNHDIFRLSEYAPYFRDVRACHVLKDFIFTHIPIYSEGLSRFKTNVHGHLHGNRVLREGEVDPKYLCVSVEQIDFRPISLDEVRDRVRNQNG